MDGAADGGRRPGRSRCAAGAQEDSRLDVASVGFPDVESWLQIDVCVAVAKVALPRRRSVPLGAGEGPVDAEVGSAGRSRGQGGGFLVLPAAQSAAAAGCPTGTPGGQPGVPVGRQRCGPSRAGGLRWWVSRDAGGGWAVAPLAVTRLLHSCPRARGRDAGGPSAWRSTRAGRGGPGAAGQCAQARARVCVGVCGHVCVCGRAGVDSRRDGGGRWRCRRAWRGSWRRGPSQSTLLAVGNPWPETTGPRRKTAFLVALLRSITGSNDTLRSAQKRL